MINYIFDGSFEGLLTAIYEAYYSEKKPDKIVSAKNFTDNFLYENIYITTNIDKHKKVYHSIQSRISNITLENIYFAHLSELPEAATEIYEYLRYGFSVGKSLDLHLTDKRVMAVHRAAKKVTSENHRYLGILRFKRMKNDVYYASIEPDHNIVALMADHFKERFSDQNWIIHDLKRGLAAIYNKKSWVIEHIYSKTQEPFNPSLIKDADSDFEELWRLYFKHISIESKRNLKLQKQHMPIRYWGHLTEKKKVLT